VKEDKQRCEKPFDSTAPRQSQLKEALRGVTGPLEILLYRDNSKTHLAMEGKGANFGPANSTFTQFHHNNNNLRRGTVGYLDPNGLGNSCSTNDIFLPLDTIQLLPQKTPTLRSASK
jgi:hypothetical protein